MNKEYKIKTIQDILDIVNEENIENFKKDFSKWLDYNLMVKRANEMFSDSVSIEKVNEGEMIWIDDGKNDADINIKIVNN